VSEPTTLPAAAHTVVVERDGLRVHTFTAPEAFLANSTHIIETDNALVVVDGQFVVPYATAFRRYADALGKPIAKVFLSHAHVDHFFGIGAAFADLPVAAAGPTIATLLSHGEAMRHDRATQYGPLVPDQILVPQETVMPGVDVIDGVKYDIEVVAAAECDAQLLITLPDHGVAVVQDLVYSGTHLYMTRDAGHWIDVLQRLLDSPNEVFLAGHGPMADKAELRHNWDYLAFAQLTLARTGDARTYRAAMLAEFPQRTCPELLDICAARLFDTDRLF
jgi:glyoxylase-like metal-dependent hydrolase (beta-lactamase superfamily II)